MQKNLKNQRGQVVLITLLVLTIATTIALSLISRTTTDLTITTQVEESSRAFSAAEAGIEEALLSGVGTSQPQVLAPGVKYEVSVASIGNAVGVYALPEKTKRGETETIWLAPHNASGGLDENSADRYRANSIDVCWSSETTTPAIVVTVLYKQSTGAYETVKAAYDPDSTRTPPNRFTSSGLNGNCGAATGTSYKATITFSDLNASLSPAVDSLLALRIRPVYSDTKIVVDTGGNTLPLQGNRIESRGYTDSGTNRKIVVYQLYRSASTIFDAALYSESSIVQ